MQKAYASPKLLKNTLIIAIVLLALLHVLGLLMANGTDATAFIGFKNLFDLDQERNIPTLYSGFLYAVCAFLALIHASKKGPRFAKLLLSAFAAFFLYLAFDETLIIHELLASPIRNILGIGNGNPLYHAWVVPALIVIIGLYLLYRVVQSKDASSKQVKWLILYVGILGSGVVALEIIGTQLYFSELVYKLGPVMIEEVYELSMASFILYRLNSSLSK